jgi:hypothetical protein
VRLRQWVLLLISFFVLPFTLNAQESPQNVERDAQAINLLAQCLSASGGASAIMSIKDFAGTGEITYFWAGKQVQGSVTIRGIGLNEFRLDAEVPNGTRSWIINNMEGALIKSDGTTASIPYSNAVNRGSFTFPLAYLQEALNDASTSVTYKGQVTLGNKQVYDIQLDKPFPGKADKDGRLSKLSIRDFLIDPSSFLIVATKDSEYGKNLFNPGVTHEVDFGDYSNVNGIAVPLSITEFVGGQETSTLKLDSVSFNTGLTDDQFQLPTITSNSSH